MPPNYRGQQGLALRPHERRAGVVAAAVLVAAGAAAGAWAAAGGGHAHGGGRCVNVVVAGSTGGGALERCGVAASGWCATVETAAGETAALVRAACRETGFLPSSPGSVGPWRKGSA